jgi:transcriptional regulator with XRE-family HTH domain
MGLAGLRQAAELTQVELARRLGVSGYPVRRPYLLRAGYPLF